MNHAHGPIGNPAAWFGPDLYPPAAIRRGAQGRTVAKLAIDADGRVTGCTVQVSSGDKGLDAGTCGIALGRGRFEPAVDADGTPIASSYRLPVRWVLPDDPSPPATHEPAPLPRPEHGWLSRLNEAHHLIGFGAVIFAYAASQVRRWFGWGQFDSAGRELAADTFRTRTRLERIRSGRFRWPVRLVTLLGPVVLLAIALGWLGW